MKNNPVFQVLVTADNVNFLGAGSKLEDLAVGQLGLFNAETNLSVAIGDTATFPAKFFFAVGVANSAGTLGDVRVSAGQVITKSLINSAITQQVVAAANQVSIIEFDGFIPTVDKEIFFRFNFMNAATMYMQGFNHPAVSIVVPITEVVTADQFLDLAVAEINANNQEGLFTALKVGSAIQITFSTEDKVATLAGLNPKYRFLRQFAVKVSVGGDIDQTSWSLSTTGPVYQQGSGYDIQQMEYLAGGWNGKPGIYRDSDLTGLIGHPTEVLAIAATNYYTIDFNYEVKSHSGGNLEYSNQCETIIAIPQTSDNLDIINDIATMVIYNSIPGGASDITTTAAPVTTTTTTKL